MVFGIIGMVNFAHGDVFMLSTFIALIFLMALTQVLGLGSLAVALFIVLILAMLLTSLWAWAIERLAYRPLRGSFRLAPLISAIGMSIFLSNLVQVTQGPRNKPVPSDSGRGDHAERGATRLRRHALLQADHDRGGHGHAAGRLLVPRAEHVARPGAARLRAGPADGRAARRRRRPHHLAHLRDRAPRWPPSPA